ncbi:MAG TPA: sialidase family protein [Pyrinomonadaceae bacterium]|nr:sialidase family protein [Pyrinomonadaceae bacterium]
MTYLHRSLSVFGIFVGLVLAGCTNQQSSKQQGVTASTPTANSRPAFRVSSEGANAAEPAIAAGTDGSIYIAWVEHRQKGEADVMVARYDRQGKSDSPAVRVNPLAGEACAWAGDPPTIKVGPDESVYVGWTARVGELPARRATTLYLSASRDGGRSFAAPVKVNDDSRPALHGMYSLAVSADHRVYLAWLDERNVKQAQTAGEAGGEHEEGNREVFMAASTDGGRSFTANQRVAADVCPCCKTALAVGPDKRLYLGWRQVLPGDFRHIAVASSADEGRTFSAPVIVSDDRWQINGCPVSGPALAVGFGGSLRVVWYTEGEAGERGLYWSESQDEGRSFAGRKLFFAGQASGTPALLNASHGNGMTAVWEMGGESSSHLMTGSVDEAGQVATRMGALKSEHPTAAAFEEQRFVAYISTAAEQHEVWLMIL